MSKINLEAAEARTLLEIATSRGGAWPGATIATALLQHGLITPYTTGSPGSAIYGATESGVRWLAQNGSAPEVRSAYAQSAAECTAQGNGATAWHCNEMVGKIDAWQSEAA